ncbi:MAG: hypothetical protein IJI77_04785 [Erysipelotrichaceae bacterium]|nr:hypothetical protein [Erysipelotrichaceae bacterium]
MNENKNMSSYYLDAFLDSYHEWTLHGKGLKYASRELRYCLNAKKQRLQEKGIVAQERYEHVKDEIRGSLLKKGDPYEAMILYREGNRITTYRNGEKILKEYKVPVTFYGCLLNKKNYEDHLCTCPNCGHQTLLSELNDGCPYCGTVFETGDSYPCFTSSYTVNSIVERATLMDRLKKRMLIVGITAGVLIFAAFLFSFRDYVWYFRILGALFMAGLYGGVSAFIAYMGSSLFLMVKLFHEAGKSLPLLSGLNTRKKLLKKLESIDPGFSFEYFEGRILSLFRTIAYSRDRESLSIYAGHQDLSALNDLIDIQYRGALQLKDVHIGENTTQIRIKAFLSNTYEKGRIYHRDENYLLSVERENGSLTDPGFSLLRIQCPNCGGSFDALHEKHCPHCGSDYDLVHDDWIITEIRKV